MNTLTALGIDVAKRTLAIAGVSGVDVVFEKTIPNTFKGIEQLLDALRRTYGDLRGLPCVVEATGGYQLPIATIFARAGCSVKVVNPLETAKLARSSIRGSKTDRIDAKLLASYAAEATKYLDFVPDPRCIEATAVASSLAHLEMVRQELQMHLHKRVELEAFGFPAIRLMHAEEALDSLEYQIKKLRERAQALTDERTLSLADSAGGISRAQVGTLACLLAGKIFSDPDKLVAFVGFDIRKKESGDWRGRESLSKRGNPYARKILFQMAFGLSRYHDTYKTYRAKKKSEGFHHTAIITATARKFLRAYWATCMRDTTGVPHLA